MGPGLLLQLPFRGAQTRESDQLGQMLPEARETNSTEKARLCPEEGRDSGTGWNLPSLGQEPGVHGLSPLSAQPGDRRHADLSEPIFSSV